jgi:hypothetical protein
MRDGEYQEKWSTLRPLTEEELKEFVFVKLSAVDVTDLDIRDLR